jgi:glycosyltransferase involved in cell wall biosynthesis
VTSSPLVSIVTPSFNQAAYIEATIRSVHEQDYPRIEHIVVDGGSTDGTLELLGRYPHLVTVSEPDEGQADALDKGFRLANGEILAWLNSDDLYLPGAVSQAVETLQRSGAALVYSGYRRIDATGGVVREQAVRPFDRQAALNEGNPVPQPTAFFTRAAYCGVGGIDRSYHYAMDYELWLRLSRDYEVLPVDAMWAAFRVHPASKTVAQQERFWREERRAARAHGGSLVSTMWIEHLRKRRPLLADAAARAVRGRDMLRAGDYRRFARRLGATLARR